MLAYRRISEDSLGFVLVLIRGHNIARNRLAGMLQQSVP